MMKYWNYYKLVRNVQSRTHQDHYLLMPIYNLLGFCLLSLFSFATTLASYPAILLIHLSVFYMTMAYNFPLVIRELALKKSDTYRTNKKDYLQLLAFLLFENNPLLPATTVYFFIALFLSLINHQKLFLLIYALLATSTLLLTKLTHKKWLQSLGQAFIFSMTFLVLHFQNWLILSTLAIGFMIVLWFKKWPLERSISAVHQVNFANNKVAIRTAAWIMLFKRYPKILVGIGLSCLLGFTLHKLFGVNMVGTFAFIGLLEMELSLDEKYKYLHRFIPKYYFLKHGNLTFTHRYLISHHFLRIIEISIYLIAFGLASQTTITHLCMYIIVLLLLGITYYHAEEQMYNKQKKVNNFLFQYGVFICLSLLVYIISFI